MLLWFAAFWMLVEGSFCVCCPAVAARIWEVLARRRESGSDFTTRCRWLRRAGAWECLAGVALTGLAWARAQA